MNRHRPRVVGRKPSGIKHNPAAYRPAAAGDASDPAGDGLHSASDDLTPVGITLDPVGIMPDPDSDGLPENGKIPIFGQKQPFFAKPPGSPRFPRNVPEGQPGGPKKLGDPRPGECAGLLRCHRIPVASPLVAQPRRGSDSETNADGLRVALAESRLRLRAHAHAA